MDKSPEAFRTISEAATELDLPQHVLRFWETRFSHIKPLKRGGGRRYYRPDDVALLKGIRHLLYDKGFTIKGVQRILKDQGVRHVIEFVESPDAALELSPPAASGDKLGIEFTTQTPRQSDSSVVMKLSGSDKDQLSAIITELLACKRMLDNARES